LSGTGKKGKSFAGNQAEYVLREDHGPYMREIVGTGAREYFQSQDDMLDAMDDFRGEQTPMTWDFDKKMYVVDFDSADLLDL
jgi:hypothetical protein